MYPASLHPTAGDVASHYVVLLFGTEIPAATPTDPVRILIDFARLGPIRPRETRAIAFEQARLRERLVLTDERGETALRRGNWTLRVDGASAVYSV